MDIDPNDMQPYACAVCNTPEHHHGSSWHSSVGYHTWFRPTDEIVRARMQYRLWRRQERWEWWAKFRLKNPSASPDEYLNKAPMTAKERDRLRLTVTKRRAEACAKRWQALLSDWHLMQDAAADEDHEFHFEAKRYVHNLVRTATFGLRYGGRASWR